MNRRSLVLLVGALLVVNLLIVLRSSGCGLLSRSPSPASPAPTVVLVSIDGFRWDYLDRYDVPVLQALARDGVRAERLIPSFPTKTFPNHYTIVTGLYPEHHGIISNTMYDPRFDAWFSLGNREAVQDARWWGGEPIWVTAEQQGQKTAAFFWPGSEAPIKGTRPTYWTPYDGSIPGEARVDRVLSWLELPATERPTFITLYFSDVDHEGHEHGPDAPETIEAVRAVDAHLGRLVEGLKARGLYDAVNLIVVSDHGMAPTSAERVILLDDYVDLDDVRVVDRSPVLMVYPKEERAREVYDGLKRAPHLQVFWKEEVPDRLRFRDHYRIPPLLAVADAGWVITTRERFTKAPAGYAGGAHGYDQDDATMGALFVAHGPAFKKGLQVGPFSNVHLYNLMAFILGLDPAPNDGDLSAVEDVLSPEAATH